MNLHAQPQRRDVLREQVRIVALGLKLETIIIAVVVAAITAIVAIDAFRGNAASWFESDDDLLAVAFIALVLPFAIWRREKRFGASFLWTLPVDRRELALMKVFAGWMWLMAVPTSLFLGPVIVGALAGAIDLNAMALLPFSLATAIYLFASALLLGLRYPLRWLVGAVASFLLIGSLTEALQRNAAGQWEIFAWSPVTRWLVYGPYGIQTLLASTDFFGRVENTADAWLALSPLTRWLTATVVWVGLGLAAVWIASFRQNETRRLRASA